MGTKDFTRIHFIAGREENTNFIIYYVEIVIGNDFSLVRISAIRIFRGGFKAFTEISLTSIHIRAVVVFNHVAEQRRRRSAAGIRCADIRTARDIIEVDASQRRNACRFDHNLIRFQKTGITASFIGIGLISLNDIVLEGTRIPFIFFVLNGIAITDPVRLIRNCFFVIAMATKNSCIMGRVVFIIHKHCHILTFYCRTCIGRVRRSHSAS